MKYLYVLYMVLVSVGCGKYVSQKSPVENSSHLLPEIEWLETSRKQLMNSSFSQGYYSYPRMIQLSNNDLIYVYECNGNVYMNSSNDLGETWQNDRLIAQRRDNINATVPEIISLKNGEIIIAYNLRPAQNSNNGYDPAKQFSIAIKKSSDKGKNWSEERILYKGGYHFENGCWEPAMVQLPDNSLYLFFSNEAIYTESNEQNISVLKSSDNGNTWSSTPGIISFAKNARDGMPVPIIGNSGKLIFSIEDNSDGGEFKPSVLTTALPWTGEIINEHSQKRKQLLRNIFSKEVYAGAPFLRQLNTGEFFLSFQTTYKRTHKWNLSTFYMVSFDKEFNKFRILDPPFRIPNDKAALWNSFVILNDNKTIIALTATNAFNDYNAIWMIKGQIK